VCFSIDVRRLLIDLLHLGGGLVSALDGLKLRKVFILFVVINNGQAELDHAVDAASELGRLFEREAGGKKRGVEQQPDKILDGLVGLVGVALGLELGHDRVVRVDLHGLLGNHVGGHGGVAKSLRLHDALHVGGPAELGGGKNARRLGDTGTNADLLDLRAEDLLHELDERLELSLELLGRLLLVLVIEVEAVLGDGHELLAVVLLHLLHSILIDGVDEVEDLNALLLESLKEGGI